MLLDNMKLKGTASNFNAVPFNKLGYVKAKKLNCEARAVRSLTYTV